MRRGRPSVVVVGMLALLSATTLDARKRKVVRLITQVDACSSVCEFALCAGPGLRPDVVGCAAAGADMVIQLPLKTLQDLPTGPLVHRRVNIDVRGTRVYLDCVPKMLPCRSGCNDDADCFTNGPLSRCVGGTCQARLGCE